MRNKHLMTGRIRRKMAIGGDVQYGSEITYNDISNRDVGAVGNSLTSVGSGALTGAAIGSVVPGIGTLVGGAVGAVAGFIGGLFGNRKRKKQRAAAEEAARQQQIANMETKIDADYQTIQNSNLGNYSETNGFYMAMGGVRPNSSNSQVAYGATHNQRNIVTGGTGVDYMNVEVEGGGDINGRMYDGEVIKNTSEGDIVFSDRLRVPGTGRSYADIANQLTSRRGKIERNAENLSMGIASSLDILPTQKLNKLEESTVSRNIGKGVYDLNRKVGRIAEIDNQENQLFSLQENQAQIEGLRNDTLMMATGGRIRKPYGGTFNLDPVAISGINGRSSLSLRGLNPQGVTNIGINSGANWSPRNSILTSSTNNATSANNLNINPLGMIANIGLQGLNYLGSLNAARFEEGLNIPTRQTVEAPRYNTRYDITNQLASLEADKRNVQSFVSQNTSNAQVSRNAMSQTAIQASRVRNDLYDTKNKVEQEGQNRNIHARYETDIYNNNINYENAVGSYNRAVASNMNRNEARRGFLQGVSNFLGDINDERMQRYAIGSQNILQASSEDTRRLTELHNNVWGTGFNPFKQIWSRQRRRR